MNAIDVATNETVVDEIHHIDRGYERIEDALDQRRSRIRRVSP